MEQSWGWLTVDRLHCEMKRASEMTTGFLVVSAAFCTLFGIFVINSYLSAYSLPFVLLDSSISFGIQVFGFLFVYWTAVLTVYCFIPLLAPYVLSTGSKRALPHLLYGQASRRMFLTEYGVFYSPVYAITIAALATYLLALKGTEQSFILEVVIPASFVCGLLAVAVLCYLRQGDYFETGFAFLWVNSISILWVLFLESKLAHLAFDENATPTYSMQEVFLSILLTILPLLGHFLLTLLRPEFRIVIVAPVLFMVIVQLAAGFPAFGGFVLREAGAGGGTPLNFISEQTGSKPQHGCLVLATSTYLYIEPIERNVQCPTLVRMQFSGPEPHLRKVDILAREKVSFPPGNLVSSD